METFNKGPGEQTAQQGRKEPGHANFLRKAGIAASTLLLSASLSAKISGKTIRPEGPKGSDTSSVHAPKGSLIANWSIQSGVSLRKNSDDLTWAIHTVKRVSNDGNGYAAGVNFVTNNHMIGQFFIAYNWPNSNGSHTKGFQLIFIGFNQDKKPFLILDKHNNEQVREFDSRVKEGQNIEMEAKLIKKGLIYISAWNMQAGNMMSFRVFMKDATKFIGCDGPFRRLGMTTGPMVEERHLHRDEVTHGKPIEIMMMEVKGSPGTMFATEFNGSKDKLICDSPSPNYVTPRCNIHQSYKKKNGMLIFTFDGSDK